MKRLLLGLAVAALASTAPAVAQAPIIIKFSHVVTTDAPKGKAAERFKELTEKYTGGKVKVELYPNSQLYKDKEELEALQLGAVQMLAPSVAKFGPIGVKEYEVFDLPYIFPTEESFKKAIDSPVMAALGKKLEDKGITPLAYWDNGFHIYTANKPLRTPDDFRGLKMRIQSSKVLDAATKTLGAIPQVMAFGELYQALQTGVVDGCDNVPSNIYTQKFYEVQKHITVSQHGHLTYAVVVNKKFWDAIPDDVRAQVSKAMQESTVFMNETAKKDNAEALELIKASGKTEVYVLSDAEKKVWIDKLVPVHKDMEARLGKDFIQSVYKVTGFTPGS